MTESIQSDAHQQQIDAICRNIVQQLKQGQSKQAIASLKRALERYPDNAQLRGLHTQIQQKVKASKIKKLEYEAMVLIQKGAESEGQKKLREIYQMDPSRTDLKDAVEKKLREESRDDFHATMRKDSVRQLCFTIIGSVVFIVAVTGWSNQRHLKNAREHIDNGAYQQAVIELNDCGWLMAGQKPQLRAELEDIEKNARTQAENFAETKNYTQAVKLMQKASQASQFPEDYDETIQNLQNLKRSEEKALAAAVKSQRNCQAALNRAQTSKAETDAASLWEQAKTVSEEAERLLAAEEYAQANETWLKSIELFENAGKTAVRVQADRADANTARQKCGQKRIAAQKMNAPIEASAQWAQASEMAAAAENQFRQRDYAAAGQTWNESSEMFETAIEVSRRSPSYLAAIEKISKWKELHLAMSEKAVTSLLGEPLCRIAESGRCVLYYQELPKPAENTGFASGTVEPPAGSILFENKGLEFAVENARLAHEKELAAENRRYEADLKRHQKLTQESTRIPGQQNPRARTRNTQDAEQAIYAEHQERLQKISTEYAMVQKNLAEGVTPINPVYLSADWVVPEPNNIVALLVTVPLIPATPAEKWQSPENWQKLKQNMEYKYVENLLGSLLGMGTASDKTFQFGNVPGFGQLHFVRGKDGQPRLTNWKEPFWPAEANPLKVADNIPSDPNDLLARVGS
jgi:hypothetical protein